MKAIWLHQVQLLRGPGAELELGDALLGADGRLDTPCFAVNPTNWWETAWTERERRIARQAGLVDGGDRSLRGDDIVLFLLRSDIDEGEEAER